MMVLGVLDLHGYDHIIEAEAEKMEALEIDIVTGLGFAHPYLQMESLHHG
jgi:probable rRNA maturation factor